MTNRYSVTAMYSLAAEQDVEVEDELARGKSAFSMRTDLTRSVRFSSEEVARAQSEDLGAKQEELCPRARRSLSRCENRSFDSESDGSR